VTGTSENAAADRVDEDCGQVGAVPQGQRREVMTASEPVRRCVQVGAGVADHADPSDGELGTGGVVILIM